MANDRDKHHDANEGEPVGSRLRFWVLVTVAPVVLFAVYLASVGPAVAISIRLFGVDNLGWTQWVYFPIVWLGNQVPEVQDPIIAYLNWWCELLDVQLFP